MGMPSSHSDDAPNASITVSARVGFDTVDEIADRLSGIDFPIELALPWRHQLWQAAMQRYAEMVASLERLGLDIASIHATQGRISNEAFLYWGRQTCELAARLGARVVTVHPNRAKHVRDRCQEIARQNLVTVAREAGVTISVETFGGADRVFTPGEIVACRLPMTLDASHLHHDKTMELIRAYSRHILVLHLSAIGSDENHPPIDAFCLQMVNELARLEWSGQIVLEYLPWHHYRLRQDIALVNETLGAGMRPARPGPPNDTYRTGPDMWHHNAPPP